MLYRPGRINARTFGGHAKRLHIIQKYLGKEHLFSAIISFKMIYKLFPDQILVIFSVISLEFFLIELGRIIRRSIIYHIHADGRYTLG